MIHAFSHISNFFNIASPCGDMDMFALSIEKNRFFDSFIPQIKGTSFSSYNSGWFYPIGKMKIFLKSQ
jgi:hypothetical protein